MKTPKPIKIKEEPVQMATLSKLDCYDRGFRIGYRIKWATLITYSILLIVASLLCGQTMGLKSPHSLNEIKLLEQVSILTTENKELKEKCRLYFESMLERDIAVNKI